VLCKREKIQKRKSGVGKADQPKDALYQREDLPQAPFATAKHESDTEKSITKRKAR
jgi:hypothetical protein